MQKTAALALALAALPACGRGFSAKPAHPSNTPVFSSHGRGGDPKLPAVSDVDIRVQIFPHLGVYPQPQGRETELLRFSIRSEKPCTATPMDGGAETTALQLDFDYDSLDKAMRVTCEKPATLVREAALKSFTYEGSFEIRRSEGQSRHLVAVNIVPLETYVKGVVPAESPASWPAETLKAQAVAARTYALHEVQVLRDLQLRNRPKLHDQPVTIDDTVQYQAYPGTSQRQLSSDAAVDATRGEIMGYQGKVVMAYFSADSGGHTEDAKSVFGNADAPYCQSKAEIYDVAQGPKPWTKDIPAADLVPKLAGESLVGAQESVSRVAVDEGSRLAGGHLRKVILGLAGGAEKSIGADDFRRALGLRSTNFTLRTTATGLTAEGRGFGHAVGMSQWGAKILSDTLHWDYRKILSFYYTGIEFCSVTAGPQPAWTCAR